MYTKSKAEQDYMSEIIYFQQLKIKGSNFVSAEVAGELIAGNRLKVPIDEVIADWKCGLKQIKLLQEDESAEKFNY